jgi:hypothetical protein
MMINEKVLVIELEIGGEKKENIEKKMGKKNSKKKIAESYIHARRKTNALAFSLALEVHAVASPPPLMRCRTRPCPPDQIRCIQTEP